MTGMLRATEVQPASLKRGQCPVESNALKQPM
jgi:hypothetical protein